MISIVTSETITDGFHFPERAFKALSLKIEDLNDSIITILNDLAPIMFISVYSIL